jgi:hypothetical protein
VLLEEGLHRLGGLEGSVGCNSTNAFADFISMLAQPPLFQVYVRVDHVSIHGLAMKVRNASLHSLHITIPRYPISQKRLAADELLLHGAISPINKKGQTFLHLAVLSRSTEIVAVLLDKGAVVSAQDLEGSTALHLVAGRFCAGTSLPSQATNVPRSTGKYLVQNFGGR